MEKYRFLMPILVAFITSCELPFGLGNITLPWEKSDTNSESSPQGEITHPIYDDEIATIWSAPNTVSIMQDVPIIDQCEYWGEEWLDNADKLAMRGIKGETESIQLMITAKDEIPSFMFKAGDLKKEGAEDVISKDNVGVYAERYIEVKSSSASPRKANMFSGFYPDALVPINSYKARRENYIDEGMHQGIFLTVDIPSNTEAGNYIGEGTLTLGTKTYKIPFSIEVLNVTINEEIHKRTAFSIWGGQIGYGETLTTYEDETPIDWYNVYYDFLISKRVTPGTIDITTPGDSFAEAIVKKAQDVRVTGYNLPYSSAKVADIDHNVVNYDSLITTLTALANKNIALREAGDTTTDLFKKAYFYFGSIIDEPTSSTATAVKYCDKAVRDATAEVAELLNSYPDLKESCLNVRHVVTAKYTDIWSGSVQTWCSQAQAYTSEVITTIREKNDATDVYDFGERFWDYMTCDSNNPYPSFQLDDNLMSTRILSWMDFDYGIDCTLYWNVCFYQGYTTQNGTTSRDLWNNPKTWCKANGDGMLLYPGSKYGLEHPLATLRLENYREGSEDYEYLYMIQEEIKKLAVSKKVEIDTNKFLQKYFNQLYKHNTMVPTTNVNNFANVRNEVLDLLDMLVNDSEAAYLLIGSYLEESK